MTVLPETLCIHLKRFRHEYTYTSKISTKVTFPLVDLDLAPFVHSNSRSQVTMYDLSGIICHRGSFGGGHYTAYAINPFDNEWYEFDDSRVTQVEAAEVMAAEAFVLFYRKNNMGLDPLRVELQKRLQTEADGLNVKYFVSKQWLNKLKNFAEPGPIDNSDFLCHHGGVLPQRSNYVYDLCEALPQSAWGLLHKAFGGGPVCTR